MLTDHHFQAKPKTPSKGEMGRLHRALVTSAQRPDSIRQVLDGLNTDLARLGIHGITDRITRAEADEVQQTSDLLEAARYVQGTIEAQTSEAEERNE